MTNKALLVAFHFPPIKASSGLERSLSLARHLPRFGWEPLVLSASPSAYPATSDERMGQIPPTVEVRRSLALDVTRHLAIAGRHPKWMTLPDRWQTWALSAIPAGLSMIRRHRPQVIWSTYPIATAHWIGYALHRLSGVPWVADFRDPMVEKDVRTGVMTPHWPALLRARLAIERRAAAHADALSFCTEGARKICMDRYPDARHERWRVMPNGFDETAFAAAASGMPASGLAASQAADAPIVLLHSGTIYPSPDRDPSHFFRALRRMLDSRPAGSRPLRVVLRASGVEQVYAGLVGELGLQQVVDFQPGLPYEAALREMLAADGLLIFQGYTSNPAVPAKLYEYFRARRPILALADADGDTAGLIRQENVGTLAPLDDEAAITQALASFITGIESDTATVMSLDRVAEFERTRTVEKFAALFDSLALG
ncbi:glycosyltransferase [Pelomonas sp. SE-A7]|uniref:glycosyltransferase n=1 Tax=Pelomonas sp. SE-A7 TaxID=3054953 RepID=UPI00259CE1D8|nr:glycosyltransferase [Pelomonas sp. SE-A7]MDM4764899.1 glycosyltransferase [Pelomonas sp. SE-A7]